MGNIKQINIKNYFFNDMINIKNFDPSLIKIDLSLIFIVSNTSQ